VTAAKDQGLSPIEQVARLRLEPGDVVVVTIAAKLTRAKAEEVRRQFADALPDHTVIVTTPDVDVKAVNPDDVPDPEPEP
jgi:hypothetical protein